MKKIILFAATAIAMLSVASCQKEQTNSSKNGNAQVSLTVQLPDVLQTKAMSQAENADIVYFEVWNSDWTKKLELQDPDYPGPLYSTTVSQRKASIDLTLVANQTYNFIFWAQNENCGAYDVTDLQNVKVDYNVIAAEGNQDKFDAFYAVESFTVNGSINETVVLYRPFAQLNFGTDTMETSFGPVVVTATEITVSNLATTFNTRSGLGVDETTGPITFKANGLATSELLVTGGGSYTWVTMDYMLMMSDESIVDVDASFGIDNMNAPVIRSITNVPLKKNHRTNIVGDLFTADAVINVIIDEHFDVPDEIIDLSKVSVANASDLASALANPDVEVIDLTSAISSTGSLTFDDDRELTINMNDYPLSNGVAGGVYDINILAGSVTFNDANFPEAGGMLQVAYGAQVVFNGGTSNIKSDTTNPRYNFYAVHTGTVVIINDGTFSFETYGKRSYVYAGDSAVVYINGGTFGPASKHPGNIAPIRTDSTGQVIITGGTFGFDPTKWLAAGYQAVKSGSTWTVEKL